MPKHLFAACLLYIVSRGAMAALAPFYETGFARITSPVLMLLIIVMVAMFMLRAPWTWKFMRGICVAEIALNIALFPTVKFHGVHTPLAQALVAAIVAACCVILWSILRSSSTKSWFQSDGA